MTAFGRGVRTTQCRKVAGSCRSRSPKADISVGVCFRSGRRLQWVQAMASMNRVPSS
jgi:hypothetical protein